jgi:probable rRNA maturation factor
MTATTRAMPGMADVYDAGGGLGGAEIAWQNPARSPIDAPVRWLERLVGELAPDADTLGVRLVTRRESAEINSRYRHRGEPTDVLSFPGDVSAEGSHLGDIVICSAVARDQARRAGHSPEQELKTLLLHGVLHCLGHDHETDDGGMEQLEQRLRQRWIGNGS